MVSVGECIEATIKIRRGDQWIVRPEAERFDGRRYSFLVGWEIDAAEEYAHSMYDGEFACIPVDPGDGDAPIWVASGDLVDVEQTSWSSPRAPTKINRAAGMVTI